MANRIFRILDLGCHDGYITLWLARQLRAKGIEVRVDGIDLMPEAVKTARRRFKTEGFKGTFKQGDALKPAEKFRPGTYDAVVAFEILEHVVDPADLLGPCEEMLRQPDGLIYISTPDGTFGTGNNPLHLHAYRAVDLADILRRRGSLDNMAVGPEGVTAASYKPHGRLGDVAIYCGPGWSKWSPHDIELKGLGGSETAAVRVAQHLSQLGYVVTVYGEVEQCVFRDVIYRHWTVFDPTDRREAVISSRIPELFDRPINSRVRLLWVHDTDFGPRFKINQADAIDHVLCLSGWHHDHLAGLYPFVKGKLRQTRNGIEPRYFEVGEVERNPHRAVFTSSPDRGLDLLLEMWPEVRKQVPDAELKHSYVDVYDTIAEQDPTIGAYRERVRQLADQPGVESVGHLSQPEVANLMRSAGVWCAPSWHSPSGQPFCETSCIGAMEAQAAGCLAVVSNVGALRETVLLGRRVENEQLSDRWREVFVRMIVEGMTEKSVQDHVQAAAPDLRAKWGWDGVARHISGLINGEAWAFGAAR